MKLLILCLLVCCIGSSCGRDNSAQARIKSYMRDTVVQKLDDPASYQFVSLQIDTFRGADYIRNIRSAYRDTSLFDSDTRKKQQSAADSLQNVPGYSESILNYQSTLAFRGKNKMGALILDSIRLFYYPGIDVVKVHK